MAEGHDCSKFVDAGDEGTAFCVYCAWIADQAEIRELRDALAEDLTRWSFWVLVRIARLILETDYPPDIFVNDGDQPGDPGPRFVGYLRRAFEMLPAEAPR